MMGKKEETDKTLERKALEGAAAEVVARYGGAAKEHYVVYFRTDNEAGKTLKKGLKQIAKSRVNKDFKVQNIKQQAGFSAEVKSVARNNADNIVKGKSERYIRTDDLGSVNDQIYDIKVLGADGKEIPGMGAQMKFVGNTPDDLLNKLRSNKYCKYLDADAKLAIADDDYDFLMGKNGIDKEIDELKDQLKSAEKRGDVKIAAEKKTQIEDCEKIKKNLRRSGLTRKEAIEARRHPLRSTAKDVGKLAHQAGIKQAEIGASVSGSISIIKNVVACMKGEKAPEEAALSIAQDTGTGTAFSYATAFSGTVIKGAMQNASSAYIQGLSKTNLTSGLVSTTMTIGKTMCRYIKGELTAAQCIENLGEQGVGEIGAAMYSAIALAAVNGTGSVAIQVIAGMAGSTLGYAAAIAVYQELSTSLAEYEQAVENRIRIEAESEEAVRLICEYRAEMNTAVEQYMSDHLEVFDAGFRAMDEAVMKNDANGFVTGNTMIQEILGHEIQFRSQKEFDDLMASDAAFKL